MGSPLQMPSIQCPDQSDHNGDLSVAPRALFTPLSVLKCNVGNEWP